MTAIITVNVDPGGSAVRSRDVAALAGRQDGVVTRAQLLAAGVAAHDVDYAVRAGRLFAVYRGVYAVGHDRLTMRGRIRAATLATGPHSAASFDTAIALFGLIPTLPAVLHVSLTRGDRRSRPGLTVHRGLEPGDVVRFCGVPVTRPLRALADLGFPDRLVREALARGLVRPQDLPADDITENPFQDRMRALIARAGLPQPIAEHPVGPYRLDFAWPDLRVAVETDGWATHGRRTAFEDDRARDAFLLAAGWRVLRVTYRRLRHQPTRVAAQLASVLAQAAAPRAS